MWGANWSVNGGPGRESTRRERLPKRATKDECDRNGEQTRGLRKKTAAMLLARHVNQSRKRSRGGDSRKQLSSRHHIRAMHCSPSPCFNPVSCTFPCVCSFSFSLSSPLAASADAALEEGRQDGSQGQDWRGHPRDLRNAKLQQLRLRGDAQKEGCLHVVRSTATVL